MKNTWKYIKLTFGMIKAELAFLAIFAVALTLCLLSPGLVLWALVVLLLGGIVLIRIYKILFYDNVYGKGAYLYQSLPVGVNTMVTVKVCAMTLVIFLTDLILASIIILVGMKHGISEEILLEVKQEGVSTFLLMLDDFVETLLCATVVFAATAWYNSLSRSFKKGIMMVVIIILAIVGLYLPRICGNVIGQENGALTAWISITTGLVISVPAYLLTIRLLKKRYILN